jgi:hypothetical protein
MASGSNGAGIKLGKAGKGKPSAAKLRKGRYKPDFSKLSPDTDVPF